MRLATRWLLGVLAAVAAVPVAGLVYQAFASWIDAEKFPPPGELVGTASGDRVHVLCVGDAAGAPTVVIESGAGNWSLHWRDLQDRLATRWRVCAYDRPGLGWSEGASLAGGAGSDPPTLLDHALTQVGAPAPYILVGHSYGGYLVRLFRDRYPDKVAGIALVEAAHENQWREIPALRTLVIEQAPKALKQAEVMAALGLLRALSIAAPDPLTDPAHREIADAAARTRRFYASFRAEIEGSEATAARVTAARSLGTLPLLVVSAARSVVPYCGEHVGMPCEQTQDAWDGLQAALARLSSDSKQVIVAGATHAIQIDAAAETARAIDEFVAAIVSTL